MSQKDLEAWLCFDKKATAGFTLPNIGPGSFPRGLVSGCCSRGGVSRRRDGGGGVRGAASNCSPQRGVFHARGVVIAVELTAREEVEGLAEGTWRRKRGYAGAKGIET